MMLLNRVGDECSQAPVTLPKLRCLEKPDDIEREAKEAAARVAEQRTIRQGVEAWNAIAKAETFQGWVAIGKALQVGRDFALRQTGANRAAGRKYSTAFNAWAKEHQFAEMPKAQRSWALALHENLDAIERWRSTLPERERQRCRNAQSVVRRWQRATQANGKGDHTDALTRAQAALRRFLVLAEALPPDLALPLWRQVQAQTAMHLSIISTDAAA